MRVLFRGTEVELIARVLGKDVPQCWNRCRKTDFKDSLIPIVSFNGYWWIIDTLERVIEGENKGARVPWREDEKSCHSLTQLDPYRS